jgi:hypothetical protein
VLPSEPATALRRSSGRLGLKGTVVGTSANLAVTGERVARAISEGISVTTLVLRCRELQPTGSQGQEKLSVRPEYGSVLVSVEGQLSHEEMLESMVLAAETRLRLGGHGLLSERPEPVVFASLESSALRFRAGFGEARKLIVEVLRQCFSN